MSARPMEKPARPAQFKNFRELSEFLKAQMWWEEDVKRKQAQAPAKTTRRKTETVSQGAKSKPAGNNTYPAAKPVFTGAPVSEFFSPRASANVSPEWSGPVDSAIKPATSAAAPPEHRSGTVKTKTVPPAARKRADEARGEKINDLEKGKRTSGDGKTNVPPQAYTSSNGGPLWSGPADDPMNQAARDLPPAQRSGTDESVSPLEKNIAGNARWQSTDPGNMQFPTIPLEPYDPWHPFKSIAATTSDSPDDKNRKDNMSDIDARILRNKEALPPELARLANEYEWSARNETQLAPAFGQRLGAPGQGMAGSLDSSGGTANIPMNDAMADQVSALRLDYLRGKAKAVRLQRAFGAGMHDYFIPDEEEDARDFAIGETADKFMPTYCATTIPIAAAQGFVDPISDIAAAACVPYYGYKLWQLLNAAKTGYDAY